MSANVFRAKNIAIVAGVRTRSGLNATLSTILVSCIHIFLEVFTKKN